MPNDSAKANILSNFANDRELIIVAFQSYLPMVDEYLRAIETAIVTKDRAQLKFSAHTFKGATSNFQPQTLMPLLIDLNRAGETGDFERASELLQLIKVEVPLFLERMDQWLKELRMQTASTLVTPQTGQILVIDDDPFSANLSASKLKTAGFEVLVRYDAVGLLDYLRNVTVDLVILDLVLKETTGLEVLKRIRSSFDHFQLPVIIATGSDNSQDIVSCLNAGANDYIQKPLELEVTIARIRSLLTIRSFYSQSLAMKEGEAIAKMIVTYNHEINNPLSIALGMVGRLKKAHGDLADLQKLDSALVRIQKIVKTISELKPGSESTDYVRDSKMFKVR